ncbi:MAG: O-antigen ligase family protein, partial [Methylobacteriaceae bacterium]|nr:O-antigen ligase family protein [Methylobacteriaceae bacterium]
LVGALLHGALPMLAALERFHAHHRILIWQAFGERAAERPMLGHGFGAIDKVWSAPRPAGVAADAAVDWVIENIHAHNQPLQIWVELGGAGAILAGLIAAAVVARLWTLAPARLAPRLAAFIAALAIALVGFGAWQAWWIATVAAALALFAADAPAHSVGETS